jgi:MATE family multidrug resistance protein
MPKDKKGPGLIGLGLYLGLSNLAHIAIGVTDVLMAGMLGSFLLAAATLAATLFQVLMLSAVGFSIGCAPLLAKYKGQDNRDGYRHALLTIILCLGVILSLASLLLAMGDKIFLIFGQDPNLIAASKDYLFYLTLALPVGSIFSLLWMIASLNGHGAVLFWSSLISIGVNMALNAVFMFGWGPIEPWGLAGLGISTFISLGLKSVFLLAWLRVHGSVTSFKWAIADLQSLRPHLPDVLRYGLPMMVLECATLAFFAALTFIAGLMGPTQLAIHAITLQMAEIGTGLAFGFSEAISITIAKYKGQENQTMMRRSFRQALLFGAGGMAAYGLCLIVIGQDITAFFLTFNGPLDPSVLNGVTSALVIAALCLMVDSPRIVIVGILRGLGDTQKPITLTMGCFWLVALPLAYILGIRLDWQVNGIWWGMVIGLGTGALLLTLRFLMTVKKHT